MQLRKTQLVELVIQGQTGGSTKTQFQFTPQTYLQNKRMWQLQVYSINDVAASPISGNALITSAEMKTAYLTLYFADPDFNSNNNGTQPSGQYVQYRSLWTFHCIDNHTDPYVFNLPDLAGQIVTWDKSFVTFTSALGNTSNLSVLFDVAYSD